MQASEQQAAEAIKTLRRWIEAAENANQDGENAVVVAADGPTMRQAILDMANSATLHRQSPSETRRQLVAIAGLRHYHKASIGSDRCDLCRRDLRDAVHLRVGEREG